MKPLVGSTALLSLALAAGTLAGCGGEQYSPKLEGDTQTSKLTPGSAIPVPQTGPSKSGEKK